jgi:3-isopropylmalate/(R)-2-methylmalate dehydratase small subunit
MTPFVRLTGIAAPLPVANVDTDQIVPKQFLKTVERRGLGAALFYDQRFDEQGRPIAGFVLDTPPWDKAVILIAGDNFGCGSSREHAPWALIDFGIRCVISTQIADIFFNNSVNNGLLPIAVPTDTLASLMAIAEAGGTLTIDLEALTIRHASELFPFTVDERVRARLLAGLDPIGETLAEADAAGTLETRLATLMPWLPQPTEETLDAG